MRSIKITKYLYTGSLFFLIFLTAVCVALSAADVIIQSLTDKTSNGKFDFRNLIVVAGSYVLLAIAAILFSCSRLLTVRASLQDIPKLYIPIKKEDLPTKVYNKIRDEFEQTKETRRLAEPRSEDIQTVGWAKPGTPLFEGLDFKQAVARTPNIVEKVAKNINPDYFRPIYVPVRQYIEFLIQQGLIDKQLGSVYLEGYELARFGQDPLTQVQYMDIMKHLAAILQNMGYSINNTDTVKTPSTTSFDRRRTSSSNRSTQSSRSWTTPSAHSSSRKDVEENDDDDFSAYDEDEVRNDIYELLMKDRSSQHQI